MQTTTDRPARRVSRTGARTGLLAGLGLLAGVAAKAADASGVSWLADLGSYPAAWVLAVALIAWSAPSTRQAATGSAVFFAVMSVGYYGWAVGVLGFGLRANLVLLAAWAVLSLTAVPAFAAVVREACVRRGALPGVLLAGAASLALADRTSWLLVVRPDGVVLHPVQGVVAAVVALVVAGVLPRHHRTRVLALVLLLPAAVLTTAAVDVLYSLLPG